MFLTVITVQLVALMLWLGKKKPVETPFAISTETNSAPSASSESRSPVPAPVNRRPDFRKDTGLLAKQARSRKLFSKPLAWNK
ncbi:MAG: hypothetical protein ACLPYZ_09640 [Limisphaerales bacterium]